MLPENTPKYDPETHTVTLPTVEGIQWKVDGRAVSPGTQTISEGQTIHVEAVVVGRVRVSGDQEWVFEF